MRQTRPEWLVVRARTDPQVAEVAALMKRSSLHTVCEEANCPNQLECFSKRTATFMILGRSCTRDCSFCNVECGAPEPVDPAEPSRVAECAKTLGLRHIVITSVTRDDLPDGGAGHFAATVRAIRRLDPHPTIEVLIPDFAGNWESLATLMTTGPDVLNHNVETVPRLYPAIRPQAVYERSLELLQRARMMNGGCRTKSGIMLGLGEREDEVFQVLGDLRRVGCDLVTIGQYLAPSEKHHPVVEYVHPDSFESYRQACEDMGFAHTAAGPFVRSSYRADEVLREGAARS